MTHFPDYAVVMTIHLYSHRSRTRIASALILAAVGLAGCGDNSPIQPEECTGEPPVFVAPEGALATQSELATDGCDPTTLDGFEVAGLWVLSSVDAFSFGQTVEFARVCDVLTQPGLSAEDQLFVSESPDGVFVRTVRTFGTRTFVFATSVCRRDDDDTLFGYQRVCRLDEDGPLCGDSVPVTLAPFGRIEGEPESDGLSLVSELRSGPDGPWPDGLETNVRVADGIAYITRLDDGMRIVDVSDPATPLEVGFFPGEELSFNDLKIVSGPDDTTFALIASNEGVMSVDVTNPSAPTLAAVFSAPGQFGMHTLFTETIGDTTLAYLADGASPILGIFDVTDPANPVEVGGFEVPEQEGIHDLFVEDGRVYLNATFAGLIVVDTQPDPQNAVEIGQHTPPEPAYSHSNWVTDVAGRRVAVHGDEGVGAHVQIIDVDEASPEFMQVIGKFEVPNAASVHNIMAFGDRAYVAWYQNGVRVLDVSDPTQPRQVAHFNTWQPVSGHVSLFEGTLGIDVDLAAGLIYAADSQRGLLVLRIDE